MTSCPTDGSDPGSRAGNREPKVGEAPIFLAVRSDDVCRRKNPAFQLAPVLSHQMQQG